MPKGYKRASGTGGVTKLSGRRRKRFYARITKGWDDNGKQLYYNLGCFETRAEAIQALENYLKSPYNTKNADMTFEDLYKLTERDQLATMSLATRKSVKLMFNRMSDFYQVPYRAINIHAVQEILSTIKPSVQRFVVNLFYHMNKEAMLLDIPCKDYSKLLKVQTYASKKEKRVFSDSEIDILWQHSDDRYIQILLVLLYTGMRGMELLTLKRDQVDFKEWIIRGGMKTKAGKNRIIPVHERIRPILSNLFKTGNNNTICLYSSESERQILYRTLRGLKIKHTVHELRHTFRTKLDDLGVRPIIINLLMGHTNGNIGEDVYTHKSVEQLWDAINLLR
jgi:integrase